MTRPAVCLVVTDLSERRRLEAVIAAESLGRSILDQAVDAVVVCDTRDDVIRASNSSHLLCGCNPLLQPFEEVFPLSGTDSTLDLEEIRRGHVLRNAPFEMKVGGKTMSLLVSAGPVVDADRQTLAAVITLTDVTELKRIEAELKEADARKDEMLAVVVHELRSPLSAIGTAVHLLEGPPISSQTSDCTYVLPSSVASSTSPGWWMTFRTSIAYGYTN